MAEERYIVSARKYRPQSFDTVVGQESITKTLVNAISGQHLAQAYLFCGPRGVGKTTCARIFAKVINSEGTEIDPDQDFSFNIFELDAASNNSVEDIRSLTDQVRIPPQTGKYRVFIIDEVHMLSQAAFNAFLKTLEEPPPHAIFILATTEKHKIIPTILSRCQIFDFNRIRIPDAVAHLQKIAEKESVIIGEDALHIIAQKADGALRDALSIFDQIVSFAGNEVSYDDVINNLNVLDYDYYFRITDHLLNEDIPATLLLFDEILKKGFDGHHFITGLGEHLRNLLVCRDTATLALLEVGESIKEKYKQQAQSSPPDFLLSALNIATEADVQYKTSNNQRLLVELALMKCCSINEVDGEKKKFRKPARLKPSPKDRPRTKANRPSAAPQQAPVQDRKPQLPPTDNLGGTENPEIRRMPLKDLRSGAYMNTVTIHEQKKPTKKNAGDAADIDPSSLPQEAFTEEGLVRWWKEYAYQAKKEGKMSLYSTMVGTDPKVDGTKALFSVQNEVQQNMFDRERGEMLAFLRANLRNYSLQLDIVMEEVEGNSKARFYSSMDRFKAMKEKNPLIDELRKRLDLDIEH